jgi:hypothetical protein
VASGSAIGLNKKRVTIYLFHRALTLSEILHGI